MILKRQYSQIGNVIISLTFILSAPYTQNDGFVIDGEVWRKLLMICRNDGYLSQT